MPNDEDAAAEKTVDPMLAQPAGVEQVKADLADTDVDRSDHPAGTDPDDEDPDRSSEPGSSDAGSPEAGAGGEPVDPDRTSRGDDAANAGIDRADGDARITGGGDTEDEPDPGASDSPAVEVSGLSREAAVLPPNQWWRQLLGRPPHPVTPVPSLSFTIEPGAAVGFIGLAGAGKTTLIEMILGATTPTSGTVRTWGLEPGGEQLKDRVGVVSGTRSQLWPDLPLDDALRILATAHHLDEARWLARRAELVNRLELAAFVALPSDQLSPGRRIRAELAASLIHEPDLLILDEPTLGLDVRSREHLRSFLRQENETHGRTLLFTAAELGDVELVCDRLLVVDQGRLVHDGSLATLIDRTGVQRTLVVDLMEGDRILDDVPGTTLVDVDSSGLRQRLAFLPGSVPTARVLADVAARAGIRDLTLEEPDLADLIRRL